MNACQSLRLFSALARYQVLAACEHQSVLRRELSTVIDIGANRGQFALAAQEYAPGARIFSFEPLPAPAAVFRQVFKGVDRVTLHEAAIGPSRERSLMHVSRCDDSSSLLAISPLQTDLFPGTQEETTIEVVVSPLDQFLKEMDIAKPAMLKLDVQGYELPALQGCVPLLDCFEWIYCECSFVELYRGQSLAGEVIDWLGKKGYQLTGIYNPCYDRRGEAVQADFLFHRKETL